MARWSAGFGGRSRRCGVVRRVERARRLLGESEHEQALGIRGVVPELGEVVVLRAERLLERSLDVRQPGEVPARDELPDEVGELLRPVRMAARRGEQPPHRLVVDPLLGLVEAPPQEAGELGRLDRAQLEALRAPPERFVAVLEDPLEHVLLAPEVDVRDLRLLLEDRPHQVGELAVERDDLLELVEDEHDAAAALGRDPARELEQGLDRVVDGRLLPPCVKGEAQAAVARVDLHRRRDAEAAEEARGPLERLAGRRLEVAVDRLRQRGGETLLRWRTHEVAVRDEDPLANRTLAGAEDQ